MPSKTEALSRRGFLLQSGSFCSVVLLAGGSRSPAAAPKPAPTPSTRSAADVGSLFPVIQSQAIQSDFPLSFLSSRFKSMKRWKQGARAKVLDLLHYSPPRCHPEAEVIEKVDQGDYVREKIHFNTTPAIRVPAYLLVPKGARRPMPAIIGLHDHGGFYLWGKEKLVETENDPPVLKNWRNTYYGGNSIASVLAGLGYVVLVIDMFYWGERRMLLDDDPADWRERPATLSAERIAAFNQRASQNEQLVGRTIFSAGFTWAGLMFWDDIRSVDYLLTHPEVDPDRIGCVGLSVGGLRACHLAAFDQRIKAAVVVGWMTSFPAQLRSHVRNTIGHTKLVPGLYRYLDYPDVASLAMPGSLLVINGKKDGLFEPKGVESAFAKLTSCYKKAGIPERLQTRLYDAPHEFNSQMQQEAWAWLKRWV
ncbi:MAG: alpha/beta hydrolase family protein [Verrucomicrobia subdivision 3 bacterium]|nr:alpha/beta hydrolase family protein [Limisphaerales bacterium]